MTTTASTTGQNITRTLARTAELAQGLLTGVTAEQFARMPQADGKAINTNHPCFIYGHLSIYPRFIFELMGKDGSAIDVPEGWEDLFKHGVECKDDVNGDIYPPMDDVLAYFKKAHEAVIEMINGCDDETLTKAFEGEGWHVDFAGTPAALTTFMLHSHYMFHLGQMSAWRRCAGLGSLEASAS
jgi:DinB superfamily